MPLQSRVKPRSVVSLFSGAGGLDIGLERAGWRTVSATDVDSAAIASLRSSQGARLRIDLAGTRCFLESTRIVHADVRDLRGPDLAPPDAAADWRPDLLAGGPPCQPWSSAGLQRGFKDPRGLLLGQMIRLANELRPRYVLMENVRGLLTAGGHSEGHGAAIAEIQARWEELGFAVSWALLNAADFGAAQRRVRLVMFASADRRLPEFPSPTHSRACGDGCQRWTTLGELLARIPAPEPEDVVLPSGSRVAELLRLVPGTGIRTGGVVEHQRPGGHWGYRQDSFLADLDLPSRTIRAASTPDWIRREGEPMRRLTWRECAALQGFPEGWVFEGTRETRFRLIGNAVQTDMAFALGRCLRDALARSRSGTRPVSPEWPEYFTKRIRGAAADHRANAASRQRHKALEVA